MAEAARRAFRQPGVTREQLEAFKAAAEAAQRGDRSAVTAEAQLAEISSTFAQLLRFTNGNQGALTVLIGIITLFLMLYQIHDSDLSTEQAHQDALLQRRETHLQTEAIQSSAQVQAKIDAELAKLNAAVALLETRQPTMQQMPPSYLPQKPPKAARPNRRDRRAAKSLARKGKH